MRSVIVFTILLVSSISHANGKGIVFGFLSKPKVYGQTVNQSSIRADLAESMGELASAKISKFHFKSIVAKDAFVREVGDAKITATMGYIKPRSKNNSSYEKRFFLDFKLTGYSFEESSQLSDLFKQNGIVSVVATGEFSPELTVKTILKDISSADQLEQHLSKVSSVIESFGKLTDGKKTMIVEVSRVRSQVYGTLRGAR